MDALAALAILASTIALSIGALGTARKVSYAALEAARAKATLTGLLNAASLPPGAYGGRTTQFSWTIDVAGEGEMRGPIRLCRLRAEARGLISERRYVYETRSACGPEPSPAGGGE